MGGLGSEGRRGKKRRKSLGKLLSYGKKRGLSRGIPATIEGKLRPCAVYPEVEREKEAK